MYFGLTVLVINQEIINNMKNILTTLILLFVVIGMKAQEVSLPPKLFTLRNSRLSMGLGMERGQSFYTGIPAEFGNSIDLCETNAYTASFDLYAPNSRIGFMFEANFGNWELEFHDSQSSEYFFVRTLELPLYLKLRFGRIEATSRMWLLAGASYIIPLNVIRNYNDEYEDTDKSQINTVGVLTATLGYEQYFGERADYKANNPRGTYDRMRIVFFARYSYLLNSRINSDYYNTRNVHSNINDYDNFVFNDYIISIGIKYFFRIGRFDTGGY